MQNFNYLVHSNSWKEWWATNWTDKFHSVSFFSAVMSPTHGTNFVIECYIAGNLQSSLKEGRVAVAFQSPRIQSPLCEWASTRLTVVLLLWTLCITTDMTHLSVNQGHGSQLPMISSMSVKDGEWIKAPLGIARRGFCVCGLLISSQFGTFFSTSTW